MRKGEASVTLEGLDHRQLIREGIARWRPGTEISEPLPLKGGMSAHLFAVQAGEERLVARFPAPYLATLFPDPAAHEHRTLEALAQSGLPSPRPRLLAEGWLLMEELPGRATAKPSDPSSFVEQMARALAGIHRVDLSGGLFDFLPPTRTRFEPRSEIQNEDLREPEVTEALIRAGEAPPSPLVLRHGDFWPGNILWSEGRISGIVDWENALRGPALADLAISRLDIWWILGREAMEDFTRSYLDLHPLPLDQLPYWDLRASLRPMANLPEWADPYPALDRPDMTPSHMRTVLLDFIGQALDRI